LVPVLGFILGTFFFVAAFMYVGGDRAHRAIWGTSAGVTIFCGILFLRIAYVSLPRGIPPFDRATDIFFAIPSLWLGHDWHSRSARLGLRALPYPPQSGDARGRHRHWSADRGIARSDAGDGRRAGIALHLQDGCHRIDRFAHRDVRFGHLRWRLYSDPFPDPR